MDDILQELVLLQEKARLDYEKYREELADKYGWFCKAYGVSIERAVDLVESRAKMDEDTDTQRIDTMFK